MRTPKTSKHSKLAIVQPTNVRISDDLKIPLDANPDGKRSKLSRQSRQSGNSKRSRTSDGRRRMSRRYTATDPRRCYSLEFQGSVKTVICDNARIKQAFNKIEVLDPIVEDDASRVSFFDRQRESQKLTEKHLGTGFPLHTHDSLDSVLRRLKLEEDKAEEEMADEEEGAFESLYSDHTSKLDEKVCHSIDSTTETDDISIGHNKLEYLMGLEDIAGEEFEDNYKGVIQELQEEVNLINGTSEATRQAQRYLRLHRIFEFFQFLIAHMLSASPYNPIDFLLSLLDKCLIFRSGIGKPPLLYDLPHIECLFNLMDRMRFGYIDLKQYKTGLLTLGLRSYNENPTMLTVKGRKEKVVEKDVFVQEAYNGLTDLFDDMIRRHPCIKKKIIHKLPKAPPPTTTDIRARL